MMTSPSSPLGVQREHQLKRWSRSKAIDGRSRTSAALLSDLLESVFNPHASSHGRSGAELIRRPLNALTSNQKDNCNASLLSGRAGVAIDCGLGCVGGPCRYFLRGSAVSLASVRGLARAAGGSGACCHRAAREPWPDDPDHRRHHGAEERISRPEEE